MNRALKARHLPDEANGSTWGDVVKTIESFRRCNTPNFNDHSVLLLGEFQADSTACRLFAVFSMEHLFLNAYR